MFIQTFVVICAVFLPAAISADNISVRDHAIIFAAQVRDADEENQYYIRTDRQTQESARNFCTNNGMSLLEIPNVAVNNLIQQTIIENGLSDHKYWTSGNRLADGETWQWPRIGQTFVYSNWASGQPLPKGTNTDCLGIGMDGGNLFWYATSCSQQQYFICQKRL